MQIYLNPWEHILWSSGKILNIVCKSISGQKHLCQCVHFYLERKYIFTCNLFHSLYEPFPQIISLTKETPDGQLNIKHSFLVIIRSDVDVTSLNKMTPQAQKQPSSFYPFVMFSFSHRCTSSCGAWTNQNGLRAFSEGILLAWFGGMCCFEWDASMRLKIYFFHYCLCSQSTKQKYKAIFFLPPFSLSPFVLSSPVEFKLKKGENWSCCRQGDCNMHIWFLWWI